MVDGQDDATARKRVHIFGIAVIPLFWNTLAGDAFYATLLFGGYALAERFIPSLRPFDRRASA